jgi:hypothetical protein
MASSATIHWWGEELSVTVAIGGTVALAGDTLDSLLQRAQAGLPGKTISPSGHAGLTITVSSPKNLKS